jgi:hypothetical protein
MADAARGKESTSGNGSARPERNPRPVGQKGIHVSLWIYPQPPPTMINDHETFQ